MTGRHRTGKGRGTAWALTIGLAAVCAVAARPAPAARADLRPGTGVGPAGYVAGQTGAATRAVTMAHVDAAARVTAARAPAADTARALHLLERATFGVRPADLALVLREGRSAWLDAQLHPERIDDAALEARLQEYPAASMTVAALYRAYPPAAALRRQQQRRQAADSAADMTEAGGAPATMSRRDRNGGAANETAGAPAGGGAGALADPNAVQTMRRQRGLQGPARMIGDFVGARLARDVYSERQLQEVMVDFWFNHFNVFVGKGADRYLVARYEDEAIRPYVFGRFEDLLKATATSPAMLFYLDNWMSTSPDTTGPAYRRRELLVQRLAALTPQQQEQLVARGRLTAQQLERLRRAARQGGLRRGGINENYARELMELHTLGVDGGYTQQDVVQVARAFTGWTITRPALGPNAPPGAEVRFVFRPELHDRGEKLVLGRRLPAGRGMQDGLDVLHMLATSPATAHHIARELVQRFVSDTPDSAMVERIARVFLDSQGDLRAVTRAVFTDPDFDDARYLDTRVKTPLEVVASALRVSGAQLGPGPSRALLQTLRSLGELPYAASAPAGYPAVAADWVNGGAMLGRMNLALALAANRLDGVRIDPAALVGQASDTVQALACALLPGRDTRRLVSLVRHDLATVPGAPPAARLARAAGLILGSPDFQKS